MPPELQQRGGHLLPQHRQRSAHTGQRPRCGTGAAVHRRLSGRDDPGPPGQGAPLRVRRSQCRPARGRPLLRRPAHPPCEVRRDSGSALQIRRHAAYPHDSGDAFRQFCQTAAEHLPELPAQGEGGLRPEDEHRRARQLHRTREDPRLRPGISKHLQAGRHQGTALAPHQVGAVHRRLRPRPHTDAQRGYGRGDQLRGQR